MAGHRMRVATFNIHHGVGRDGRLDLRRTAGVITGMRADLVALQEIDRGLLRSDRVDQVRELEALTRYRIQFHAALAIDGGEYGIAIASAEELETRSETLPRVGDEERRIAITTHWQGLSVVTSHLSRDPSARRLQIQALAAMVGRLPGPAVVVGDLNDRIGRLGPLTTGGLEPALAGPGWLRRWRAAAQIDHILVGPGLHVRSATCPRTDASDHRPLVAVIERG